MANQLQSILTDQYDRPLPAQARYGRSFSSVISIKSHTGSGGRTLFDLGTAVRNRQFRAHLENTGWRRVRKTSFDTKYSCNDRFVRQAASIFLHKRYHSDMESTETCLPATDTEKLTSATDLFLHRAFAVGVERSCAPAKDTFNSQ